MSAAAVLLERFQSVSLAALEAAAPLLHRRDRKYVVPRHLLADLLLAVDSGTSVLEIDGVREFHYETVYFDTPELLTYLAAARSRPRRFKIRTRSYLDTGTCYLEVKMHSRTGATDKHRREYPLDHAFELTGPAIAFISEFEPVAEVSRSLRPTLSTRYDRITLLDARTAGRATIDTNLIGVVASGAALDARHLAIIETKSPGPPTGVDRLLWAMHHRPSKMSKYCTSMAALQPSLPANKWNRTLRTHFDWLPGRLGPKLGRPPIGWAAAAAVDHGDLRPVFARTGC